MNLKLKAVICCDHYGCDASAEVLCSLETMKIFGESVITSIEPRLPLGWAYTPPFCGDGREIHCPKHAK